MDEEDSDEDNSEQTSDELEGTDALQLNDVSSPETSYTEYRPSKRQIVP